MTDHSIYETIFMRRSVRKYDMTGNDAHIPESIRQALQKLEPLDPAIRTEHRVLAAGEARSALFGVAAPYYLAAYSEPAEGYLMNTGYMLQQLDLRLSQSGIGSCWLGMTKPSRDVEAAGDMEFVIVMAAGTPAVPVHRYAVSEFRRKPLAELTNIPGYREDPAILSILEAARLAPSASNTQPWFFSGTAGAIRVGRQVLNPLKAMAYGRMNQIDIGIALCHIKVAAERAGKVVEFIKEPDAAYDVKGFEYCVTARLE